jgi:hypothetical protein
MSVISVANVDSYPSDIIVPKDLGNKPKRREVVGKAFIIFGVAAGESIEAVIEHVVDLATEHKLYVHTDVNGINLTCSPKDIFTREEKIKNLRNRYKEAYQFEIDKCDHEWISRPWDKTKSLMPPPPRCRKCLAIEPTDWFHNRWLESLGMITGYEWWDYALIGAKTYQEGVII